MKTEQELANELDAFLTARLKGQPAQPTGDGQNEAHLANILFDLAAKAEPDPVFFIQPGGTLGPCCLQTDKRKKKQQKRPSLWQQIIETVEQTFTMKQSVFALGTIVALIIVGILAPHCFVPPRWH